MLSKTELHAKIRDINFSFDKIVVGSSLEALTYAYLNNLPLIHTRLQSPHFLDRFNPDQDLSKFGIDNKIKILKSNDEDRSVGIKKIFLWEKLYFNLSLSGQIPLESKCVSLRIDNGTLKASTSKARLAKIKFNELIVFDDNSFIGLGSYNIKEKKYKVYDWFQVRSGMKHEYDVICGDDEFVNKIYFYQSDRIDGNHPFKDAISYSYLTEDQLQDFEYSDINARFKTIYMMKQAGIKGTRNGRDSANKDRYKYYAIKIENSKRQIIETQNVYDNKDNITFIYDSFYDIIEKNKLTDSYVSRILKR
jgi:hypothetical protein